MAEEDDPNREEREEVRADLDEVRGWIRFLEGLQRSPKPDMDRMINSKLERLRRDEKDFERELRALGETDEDDEGEE